MRVDHAADDGGMVEPIRLEPIDQSVIDALRDLGAWPDRPFMNCRPIVTAISERTGLHEAPAHDALCALAAHWVVPLPLVDGHGNLGSPDDGPSEPDYVEARLSPAGAPAAGDPRTPPLPIGLINGDLHHGGTRPPFDPIEILDAIALATDRPRCSDEEILALVSRPASPTGCSVDGELDELRAGRPARIRSTARVTIERGSVLAITHLPLDTPPTWASGKIRAHLGSSPTSPRCTVDMGWARGAEAIIVRPSVGVDLDDLRSHLLDTEPVTTTIHAQLPAPLADLIRAHAPASTGHVEHREALAALRRAARR